jgi:putative ubiquitin-RnfH superfamily antitoxin RatB of RatAB toxin-antitoxin module
MSRHWTQHEYTSVDNLWCFVEEQTSKLSMQLEDKDNSELYRLFLSGKREMLDMLCTYIMENECYLKQIVIDHGVMTEEQVEESIEKEYGLS